MASGRNELYHAVERAMDLVLWVDIWMSFCVFMSGVLLFFLCSYVSLLTLVSAVLLLHLVASLVYMAISAAWLHFAYPDIIFKPPGDLNADQLLFTPENISPLLNSLCDALNLIHFYTYRIYKKKDVRASLKCMAILLCFATMGAVLDAFHMASLFFFGTFIVPKLYTKMYSISYSQRQSYIESILLFPRHKKLD